MFAAIGVGLEREHRLATPQRFIRALRRTRTPPRFDPASLCTVGVHSHSARGGLRWPHRMCCPCGPWDDPVTRSAHEVRWCAISGPTTNLVLRTGWSNAARRVAARCLDDARMVRPVDAAVGHSYGTSERLVGAWSPMWTAAV
jgi:hypothetical protein